MDTTRRPLLVRWLLIGVVALGVVLMHHAPAPHEGAHHSTAAMTVLQVHAEPAAEPMPDEGGMGAMLHECLAILGQVLGSAVLVLLAIAGWLQWVRARWLLVPEAAARGPDRAPGVGGRSVLSLVCVLRR
ncbi:DUF6153 family protein [Amycolatopsis sp. NPDC004368]